ncbi:hypothetical protein AAZX31_06G009800 [Glycine max]
MECFNDISIMSWNIRGTVGRCTWRHIRDLVKSHHPSIFLIYETHAPISWFCSAIYASPNPAARKLLWNQFMDISHLCTGP